ncbi:unnamed protein product [Paramecium sonneborni]|uniref:Uncharacterized protein n=1 Tax=Paramecium sonneborni TaxID=65129 RepID=A0A8S1NV65_9CILI|nr:unnamed protein product [Paramecium sonneborni]
MIGKLFRLFLQYSFADALDNCWQKASCLNNQAFSILIQKIKNLLICALDDRLQ